MNKKHKNEQIIKRCVSQVIPKLVKFTVNAPGRPAMSEDWDLNPEWLVPYPRGDLYMYMEKLEGRMREQVLV